MIANIKHAIRNRETVTIGGGQFSPQELQAFLNAFDGLLEAAYLAFPYVEDCEEDHCYKPGAVTRSLSVIKAAISAAERV